MALTDFLVVSLETTPNTEEGSSNGQMHCSAPSNPAAWKGPAVAHLSATALNSILIKTLQPALSAQLYY